MVDVGLDWKDWSAIAGMVIGIGGFVPYFIGVFRGLIQPHAYTWLIWSLTQGIAAAGLIIGGGGLMGYGIAAGSLTCFIMFLLSFKYGTKHVTRGDTVVLIAACGAIFVWLKLESPVLAVFMVCIIDALGYVPTYRKLWDEPYSEKMLPWIIFTCSYLFSLLALRDYNLLTLPYILTTTVANLTLMSITLVRRSAVPKVPSAQNHVA